MKPGKITLMGMDVCGMDVYEYRHLWVWMIMFMDVSEYSVYGGRLWSGENSKGTSLVCPHLFNGIPFLGISSPPANYSYWWSY
ncbi:hypothetical protein CEXT_188791 [Caerostris extrusa]|uniref:Uncharacterized protein n=1 Tax=Caerostris extrusa TaxID=172846 RepID=A0AAV4NRB6_CAEEX|nr:hypothetical protein CEXT_188791 [Caerostris extrusa]